jgi:hypothetical protein
MPWCAEPTARPRGPAATRPAPRMSAAPTRHWILGVGRIGEREDTELLKELEQLEKLEKL